uniref:Laminin G domain-containing protein n=1 Tax=Salvator merianae TaxID=96440 RepID=A0A8D0C7R1_SALMN
MTEELGWSGLRCEKQISFFSAKFTGNSYIKYTDPNYKKRDLNFTRISFNFTTNQMDCLLVWLGKAENEDDDFLAVGLTNGSLKIVVNLGERIATPLIIHRKSLCCKKWHFVTVAQNRTLIKVFIDEDLFVSEDDRFPWEALSMNLDLPRSWLQSEPPLIDKASECSSSNHLRLKGAQQTKD